MSQRDEDGFTTPDREITGRDDDIAKALDYGIRQAPTRGEPGWAAIIKQTDEEVAVIRRRRERRHARNTEKVTAKDSTDTQVSGVLTCSWRCQPNTRIDNH